MHTAQLLANSHILNKGLLTFSAYIKMDISKTNWNYLTTFQTCLRTLPKSIISQRNMVHKTSSTHLFFCAPLACCVCLRICLCPTFRLYIALFRVNTTPLRILLSLLTLPFFSRHFEHSSKTTIPLCDITYVSQTEKWRQ